MISQTAEYALRAVVCLADRAEPITTAAIADVTSVPAGYLAKIMQGLSKSGFVHAQRGLHGGFVLVPPASELTVLQVITAVEPIRRFRHCPVGVHGAQLCPLHRKLDDASRMLEATFADTTIADLIRPASKRKPLCPFPLEENCTS